MSEEKDLVEIDFEALSRKYAEERAKRLRSDATDQWGQLGSSSLNLDRDPFADPGFTRDPIVEEVDALVVGGGFGGLLAGARLRENGVGSLRILEKAADFGGTWYWNRYPGVSCDIESYVYLPLLEEMGYMPTERYASGAEIKAYCKLIADRFDLERAALFQTRVDTLRWDEARRRWIVSTSQGDEIAARFVVSCTGVLSAPKLPAIPGIDDFKGRSFHTSRWDFDYTGGDQNGKLTGLSDKVVGIIGTGSTAIQSIPHLAEWAKHLYVFQRTAPTLDDRDNRSTDPDWFKSLKPGWSRERRDNFTMVCSGNTAVLDMVNDGWTDIVRHISIPPGTDPSTIKPEDLQLAGMRKMEGLRHRIDEIIKDPATAESLKPYYHYFCKRPGFHDTYLEVFNRPNVTLVDTGGKGVERITESGVVIDGKEYKVDCLIYATGFDWFADYKHENGMEFVGRGALSLAEHWNEGPRTLYGMQTHGFPNLFFMRQAQTGGSFNYTANADEQTRHIGFIIGQCLKRGIDAVEPTREAEEGWVNTILDGAGPRLAFHDSCTPSYYNFEGSHARFVAMNEFFAQGPLVFVKLLEDWRREGTMKGLEVTRAADPVA